jgi:bifunctional DNase/RNase
METKIENVLMNVHAITIDSESNVPVLILKEVNGERSLPIWIGLLEATAIASELENIKFARPLTHDLTISMLKAAEVSITRILINDLKDNTYYATITMDKSGNQFEIDSRPSDAIALALKSGVEIFVNEKVLKQVVKPKDSLQSISIADNNNLQDILENLDPTQFKYKI